MLSSRFAEVKSRVRLVDSYQQKVILIIPYILP